MGRPKGIKAKADGPARNVLFRLLSSAGGGRLGAVDGRWPGSWRSVIGPRQAERLAQLAIELGAHVGVVLQELPGVLAPLADPLTLVAVPGTTLLDQVLRRAEIKQVAFLGSPFSVDDVELSLAEWRGDFVLHNLYFSAVAGDGLSVFNSGNASDIDTHGRVEL